MLILPGASSKDPVVHAGASLRRCCVKFWLSTDAALRAKDNLAARELKEAFEQAKRRYEAHPKKDR
eukprot:2796909-Pyramimonas_sp.AAC.1